MDAPAITNQDPPEKEANITYAQNNAKNSKNNIVFTEVAAEETMGTIMQTETKQSPVYASRFYTILKYNFKAIRYGIIDFYTYLVR